MELSLAAPDNDAWLPTFEQRTGIAGKAEAGPDIFAYQLFLEAHASSPKRPREVAL